MGCGVATPGGGDHTRLAHAGGGKTPDDRASVTVGVTVTVTEPACPTPYLVDPEARHAGVTGRDAVWGVREERCRCRRMALGAVTVRWRVVTGAV